MTKKKVELTTTRQIETRVQRQLVLEDGKVVEDSGPIVSTNTTEDTEKQEHKHTEVGQKYIFIFYCSIKKQKQKIHIAGFGLQLLEEFSLNN